MVALSPYEKMRLEKAKTEKKGPGRTPNPEPIRKVKSKVAWQAHKRAARVLLERHQDEFKEIRQAESEYLRALVADLYAEGFDTEETLLAEFYRRIE